MGRWAGDGAWARRGWGAGGGGIGEEDDGVAAAAFPQLLLLLLLTPRLLPPTAAARAVSRRREMSCARAFISREKAWRGEKEKQNLLLRWLVFFFRRVAIQASGKRNRFDSTKLSF